MARPHPLPGQRPAPKPRPAPPKKKRPVPPRLPHLSTFHAVYDAKAQTWSGHLNVFPEATGEINCLTVEAVWGNVYGLLNKLDREYRKKAGVPNGTPEMQKGPAS